jgi:hypothetical protein
LGVAFIAAVVSLRSDTRELVGFFDTARRVADSQAARAEVFQDLIRQDLDEVSRESFMTLMTQLREGLDEGIVELDSVDPPAGAAGADEVLALALESWAEGLSMFEIALLAVVDEPQSPLAELDLDVALTRLRVGDAAYLHFLRQTEELRSDVDVDIGELPAVAYLEGQPPIVSGRLAEAARRSTGLALVVDVAISAVRITPEEISEAGADVRVIPATEVIDVQVVIANNGNRVEEAVRVTVQLSTDGGTTVFDAEQVIEELAPGGQGTAFFTGLPVNPSEAYDLVVVVTPVTDEKTAEMENNFNQRRFLVNEAVEP